MLKPFPDWWTNFELSFLQQMIKMQFHLPSLAGTQDLVQAQNVAASLEHLKRAPKVDRSERELLVWRSVLVMDNVPCKDKSYKAIFL